MKLLINILLLSMTLFAGTAVAYIDVEGLSDKQVAELEAVAAQNRVENLVDVTDAAGNVIKVVGDLQPEDVERYAQIGTIVASTIKDTASGLGIAVDEFVNTSTGTLVMFLIVYHFFGAELITFVVGFLFMIPATLWLGSRFLRGVRVKGYATDEKGKQSPIFKERYTEEETYAITWIYVVSIVAIILQVFIYMP